VKHSFKHGIAAGEGAGQGQSPPAPYLCPSSKHFMQILAVRPAPDRISCGVSFRQTLQKRSVRGSGSALSARPGQ